MRQPTEHQAAIAETIVRSVEARFGERFSPEDLAYLRERIARAQAIMAALDEVPLGNGDEPDTTFAAE